MQETVNSVRLLGYVGKTPMARWYDPTTCITRLSVATHADSFVSGDGVECMGRVTDWHRVICFRQLAEEVAGSLMQGDLVEVIGRLTYTRTYNRDGKSAVHTFIIADRVHKIDKEVPEAASLPDDTDLVERYGRYFEELDKDESGLPF